MTVDLPALGGRGVRRRRRRAAALLIGFAAALMVPAMALAHPLGNFTINHYAGLRVDPVGISVDVVIDRAEIPAFQARQALDADGDGIVSTAEIEAERLVACTNLASSLHLVVAGSAVALKPEAAGLSFPPGAGGLVTMRLVCEYHAEPRAPIAIGTRVTFRDESFAERIGWREIVVTSGAQSSARDGTGVSGRLTAYPKNLLAQPLDVRTLTFLVSSTVEGSAPWAAPDAQPLPGTGTVVASGGSMPAAKAGVDMIAAVPGGVGLELASIVNVQDLTPLVILGSMLVAIGLGAAHALSPGHGKTIMAAYLVGTRGTARHALGLGLIVTVSHTLGVFALAAITLLAASVLPPERLYPILGIASGVIVIAIGGSLLLSRVHAHDHASGTVLADAAAHSHSHGGREHRHLPAASTGISWRSLFALGLSGGIVPSVSALILLLGSVATGRVAYGLVLVIGFGIGMAIVLGGVGLILVRASSLLERLPSTRRLARLGGFLQVATAVVVVALGLMLTRQALAQVL